MANNDGSIRVAVRVRPLSKSELENDNENIITTIESVLKVRNKKVDLKQKYGDTRDAYKTFSFDYVFDANNKCGGQEHVFESLGTDVIERAISGYNNCVFAYGMTGTGKTHSMIGSTDLPGLIPNICENLFRRAAEMETDSVKSELFISAVEIYNERLSDMLYKPKLPQKITSAKNQVLKITETAKQDVFIMNLSKHAVENMGDIRTIVNKFMANRTVAATHVHEFSSRSHAIFSIFFNQVVLDYNAPAEIHSKIHLVDLAGSERVDPYSKIYTNDRQREGSNINKSLVTLGTVIQTLAEISEKKSSRNIHIPYRNSKLTWLLKDSLGGNSLSTMLATVTPSERFYNETISTLRYAQKAKNIKNKAIVNEDAQTKLIRELRQEIERLQRLLNNENMGNILERSNEVENMSKTWTRQRRASLSLKSTMDDSLELEKEEKTKLADHMPMLSESKEVLSRDTTELEDSLDEDGSNQEIGAASLSLAAAAIHIKKSSIKKPKRRSSRSVAISTDTPTNQMVRLGTAASEMNLLSGLSHSRKNYSKNRWSKYSMEPLNESVSDLKRGQSEPNVSQNKLVL